MLCIYCGGGTRVTNTRRQKKANHIWRRRQCQLCHAAFTSVEEPDLTGGVMVRKSSAFIEPFLRDKLLLSMYDSLRHRKTALRDAEGVCGTIIARLLPQIEQAAISSTVIKEITYSVLRRFDKVAAVHYRAHHPVNSNNSLED